MKERDCKATKCVKNRGASLVEYALLIALIALVSLAAVRTTGIRVRCVFLRADAMITQASLGLPFVITDDCSAGSGGYGGYG